MLTKGSRVRKMFLYHLPRILVQKNSSMQFLIPPIPPSILLPSLYSGCIVFWAFYQNSFWTLVVFVSSSCHLWSGNLFPFSPNQPSSLWIATIVSMQQNYIQAAAFLLIPFLFTRLQRSQKLKIEQCGAVRTTTERLDQSR